MSLLNFSMELIILLKELKSWKIWFLKQMLSPLIVHYMKNLEVCLTKI
ncbi:formate dehydrogenase 2 [Candida albicans P75010]|nr:formate dehydrogenase 2 [Candida albicans P75010]